MKMKKDRKRRDRSRTVKPRGLLEYFAFSGTAAAALLVLQAVTGLLLLFYYKPDPKLAFASLEAIRNDLPYGMVFANIHAVGSKVILILVFVHMFRIMLTSAYRGPRKMQWYTGMGLLVIMLLAGFSGYLLPWTQQSYWACVIGTEAVRVIPLFGDLLVSALRGGAAVAGPTLTRFFALHVSLLPLVILVLAWVHVRLVWGTGVIAPADTYAAIDRGLCIHCGACEKECPFAAIRIVPIRGRKTPALNTDKCNACRLCLKNCPAGAIYLRSDIRPYQVEPVFPDAVLRRVATVMGVLIAVFVWAFFIFGYEHVPADPLLTPDRIKPEWYFMASYQVLKLLPNELLGLGFLAVVFVLTVLLPKLDPAGPRELTARPVYGIIVGGGILFFILLTAWGIIS
jgi:ubiquinol-cytochrome c reductase cytochrome b subunit